MADQRTYWHLGDLGRKPTEYDIATSRLLYYPERGFEVNVPFSAWYQRHVTGSPFLANDWEAFRDPRETTYTKYTEIQKTSETFVDQLLESAERTGSDARLDAAWVRLLDRVISPLRYPIHGLQMAAAYAGHLAPSGRVVIACLCQAADEVRRIQRCAYRMRQLQERDPGFGKNAREAWEGAACWQPLRRAVEQLLVTYDWGESLTALNLCLKPAFDALFMARLAQLARASGDELLAQVLGALEEDCRWQREWTVALVRMAIEQRPENRDVLGAWMVKWDPLTVSALQALAPLFAETSAAFEFAEVVSSVQASLREYRSAMGLHGATA